MGDFIIIIANLLHGLISLLQILIIAHVVMTWTAISVPLNAVTRFLYMLVETIYQPIRALIPTAMGGVDFTPMIALVGLSLIDSTLVSSLLATGYRWPK